MEIRRMSWEILGTDGIILAGHSNVDILMSAKYTILTLSPVKCTIKLKISSSKTTYVLWTFP